LEEVCETGERRALGWEGEGDADGVDEGCETAGFVDGLMVWVGEPGGERAGGGEVEEVVLDEIALVAEERKVGVGMGRRDVFDDDVRVDS
jgi:hypothetical protein